MSSEYESIGAELDELAARIAALEDGGSSGDGQFQDELDALKERIAALEEGNGSDGDGKIQDELDELKDRIAALEQSGGGGEGFLNLENLANALSPYLEVDGNIPDNIEESLAQLRVGIEDHSTTIANVQNRLDTLESDVAALTEGAGRRSDEEVRQLIREYVDEHVSVDVDEDAIVERVVERVGTGGGDTDLNAELEAIRRERKRFSLVGSPNHSRVIAKGSHEDDGFHRHGGWGIVVTPDEDVVWRSAKINAESAGSTQIEVYEMDYETDETYEVGDRVETHEVNVSRSGESTIHPDIVLPAGETRFITRDTDAGAGEALPLKRAEEDIDWSALDDQHDAPLTIHCTWQRGRGQPGTQAFQDYRDANWHRVLHYYRDMEFGYDTEA